MSVQARSSALPHRWAKAHRWSRHCMRFWPKAPWCDNSRRGEPRQSHELLRGEEASSGLAVTVPVSRVLLLPKGTYDHQVPCGCAYRYATACDTCNNNVSEPSCYFDY